jgi:antitoxin MazE
MKIHVIKIGNSKGIRLPMMVIKKYKIKDEIELVMEEETLLLKPIVKPRKEWDDKFCEMHAEGEDKLLIDDVFEDENLEEWK